MQTEVALRLAPDRAAPRAARHGIVEALRLEDGLADDAALLISEAVTNSVLHAGLAPGSRIHVDAWWAGERLHVEVCDEGGGMDGPSAGDRNREGGRGLGIIAAVAARWGVHTGGPTRIWFELAG